MSVSLDHTHNPHLRSWVASANQPDTDFPIQNLPLGVFRKRGSSASFRIGVAIGDQILDLAACGHSGCLERLPQELQAACFAPRLNLLLSLGRGAAATLRGHLSDLLSESSPSQPQMLLPMSEAELQLPVEIGDYTDFYASIFHATNVGQLFRPDQPLLPNYQYVPIAYHGRASSIVLSGTPIHRPQGQIKGANDPMPQFAPSQRLDYELEVGCFVGAGNPLGQPIAIAEAEAHLFGLCLVNDWSARDIQAWEYQPLGPFLAKNFATSISPWVVTLEALAPFRCPAFSRPEGDPQPLPYLTSPLDASWGGIDLIVEVWLCSAQMQEQERSPIRLSRAKFQHMYWTLAQMLTHHASSGCNLRPGDLLASGTVSNAEVGSQGCLLEITQGGAQPLTLPTGEQRTYLADGDEVILRGYCQKLGYPKVGLGECRGIILR